MNYVEARVAEMAAHELILLGAVFAIVAMVVAVVLVIGLRKLLRKVGVVHYPQKSDAQNSQQIYNELVEIRALTSADRSFVLRFHNGIEFLPSNPVWKLTCTHEFAKQGVEYCAGDYQAVLASRMIKIVGTLLTGESDDDGVRISRECTTCPDANACDGGNRRLIVVQVDEMSNGFERFTLHEQNVKTALVCGVTFEGQVMGIVGLHFCGEKLDDEEGLATAIKTLCESSQRIQYLLGSNSL